MLSFRASEDEVQRIKKLSAELIEKNRYLTEADVLRELVGLENTGLITPAMRASLLRIQPGDELEIIGEGKPNLQPGEFVLSDWRETFLALGLRVTTDGVKDWKIEFTVEAPENEYGSSGLSVLLFEAQRLNLPGGRRRKS